MASYGKGSFTELVFDGEVEITINYAWDTDDTGGLYVDEAYIHDVKGCESLTLCEAVEYQLTYDKLIGYVHKHIFTPDDSF